MGSAVAKELQAEVISYLRYVYPFLEVQQTKEGGERRVLLMWRLARVAWLEIIPDAERPPYGHPNRNTEFSGRMAAMGIPCATVGCIDDLRQVVRCLAFPNLNGMSAEKVGVRAIPQA